MSNLVPRQDLSLASEHNMEDLPTIPLDIAPGVWGYLVVTVLAIGTGVMTFLSWLRRNKVDGANAGANIDSISHLQAILAAEREDHRNEVASFQAQLSAERENHNTIVTALRSENATLRDRADKFADDRNKFMMQVAELTGEMRSMKAEMEEMKEELRRHREWRDGHAQTP